MGSATRESLAAVTAELDANKPESGVALAQELFVAARSLRSVVQLKNLVSDPSSDPEKRVAAVQQVFSSKLSEATVAVLASVARKRWSTGDQLVGGVEHAGVIAVAIEAAASGQLEQLEAQLFQAGQVIRSSQELQLTLGDSTLPAEATEQLVTTLFGGKVSDAALTLIIQAASAHHAGRPIAVLTQVAETVSDYAGRKVATVTLAKPLNVTREKQLLKQLESEFGTKLTLNKIVDPSVIGGIRVQIGSEVLDSTVKTKLTGLRQALAG